MKARIEVRIDEKDKSRVHVDMIDISPRYAPEIYDIISDATEQFRFNILNTDTLNAMNMAIQTRMNLFFDMEGLDWDIITATEDELEDL